MHLLQVIVFYRCPYLFKSYLLQNRFGYYKGDTFYVSNVEHNVFLAFLRYLYTDHLKAPSHLLRKLEALARRYRLPRLAALCRQQLSLRIITGTNCQFTAVGMLYSHINCLSRIRDTAINVQRGHEGGCKRSSLC